MCGLAGWLYRPGFAPEPEALTRMAQAIHHRGPDDEGFFRDAAAGLALAHRRLSIIDLSAASHQPMVDAASGVVLAYNGEIYNFQALRRELESLGHVFHSHGDTEVLLRSWLQWGPDCLPRLAGMFAFALWEPRTQTLHLARDALGMKPLYLARMPQGLAFASEIKAFRELPGFDWVLDQHGIQQFLEFGYVFEGNGTCLRDVEKLLPGCRVALRGGEVIERHTWFEPPAADTDEESIAQRAERLHALLEQVVAEHLIADVPVGLLLSGGLDSSLVAALAARRGPITTVCMGFADSEVDERPEARRVAEHIGSHHLEVLITASEVRTEIATGAWVFDDLFADWGTITTRILYRRCHELGLKAVLVGEGSDELFGGYDVFQQPVRGELGLWRLYQRYAGRRWGRLYPAFRRIMRAYLEHREGEAFSAIRDFELRQQLPNQYVMKVDKASMAESVEARTPYLDRRVAAFAWATPKQQLLTAGENKHLLRQVARRDGLLPETISARRKFGAPLAADWMDSHADFRAFARETILTRDGHTARLGLLPLMRDYFERGRAGQAWPGPVSIYRNLAWRLLLLELWARHYQVQ